MLSVVSQITSYILLPASQIIHLSPNMNPFQWKEEKQGEHYTLQESWPKIFWQDLNTLQLRAKGDMLALLAYVGRGTLCDHSLTPRCHNLHTRVDWFMMKYLMHFQQTKDRLQDWSCCCSEKLQPGKIVGYCKLWLTRRFENHGAKLWTCKNCHNVRLLIMELQK